MNQTFCKHIAKAPQSQYTVQSFVKELEKPTKKNKKLIIPKKIRHYANPQTVRAHIKHLNISLNKKKAFRL